jgi:myo-inositol-1(or 4)-monophosphatase
LGLFAVSIAYCEGDSARFGIVFNPLTAELFTAEAGRGARLNDTPLAPSTVDDIQDSLLVTGFTSAVERRTPALVSRFARCLDTAQGVRRLGSAALDLCFVACGRFDGFWEEYLNPWDTAAGALIVEEAGGRVTDFDGGAYRMEGAQILATNGKIHAHMISLLSDKDMR